jgi:hypothetical protein
MHCPKPGEPGSELLPELYRLVGQEFLLYVNPKESDQHVPLEYRKTHCPLLMLMRRY